MSQLPPKNPYSGLMDQEPNFYADPQAGPKAGNPRNVMIWQMIYVSLMVLLYAAVTVACGFGFAYADNLADGETSAGEWRLITVFTGILCLIMLALYAGGLFWRRGNGGWIYQIILIAIGLTSCATWPMTIPLLIGWIRHRDAIVKSA